MWTEIKREKKNVNTRKKNPNNLRFHAWVIKWSGHKDSKFTIGVANVCV